MASTYAITIGKPGLDDYPETITPFWLYIKEMKSLYAFSEFFPNNVHKLERDSRIVAWKKSRGDGNCYFRAVISTAFLQLCKPYCIAQKLAQFKATVESLITENIDYEYTQAKFYILKELTGLLDLKYRNQPIQAFEYALKLTQNKEFDLNLVRVSRLMVYNELLKAETDDEYSFLFIDGIDAILYDALAMGKEGGEHSLLFLPKALGIQVVQHMFLDTAKPSVQTFPDSVPEGTIKISIVRRSGHYDVLMYFQELEFDQADLNAGTYAFLQNPDGSFNDNYYNQLEQYTY